MTSSFGSATHAIPPSLKHISAGWVDEKLATVRKMARDGATAAEIGEAIGVSAMSARNYIRRNNLVWSKKSKDRHMILSASRIGAALSAGQMQWHEEGLALHATGMSRAQVAKACGVEASQVYSLLRKHGKIL